MTTGEPEAADATETPETPETPEDDGTVGHAIFLLELGGTWTTDCGCKTVIDTTRYRPDWDDRPLHPAEWRRFMVLTQYEKKGVIHRVRSGGNREPLETVMAALDHKCGDEYQPVVTVPIG